MTTDHGDHGRKLQQTPCRNLYLVVNDFRTSSMPRFAGDCAPQPTVFSCRSLLIPSPAQTDVHALAAKVDQHYDHMRTLEASSRKPTPARHDPHRERHAAAEEAGPDAVGLRSAASQAVPHRWATRHGSMFPANGRSPDAGQATRRSALATALLLGKTKLEKELDGLSLAPDQKPVNPGDVVLRGVPKGMRTAWRRRCWK